MNVQKHPCSQCLFTDKRIVPRTRAVSIVNDCLKRDTYFVCHKTQIEKCNEDVVCHTFWNRYKNNFNLGRIAQRLRVVKFVSVGLDKQ